MLSHDLNPAPSGLVAFMHNRYTPKTDDSAPFQVLPTNLSAEEIRVMVRDILG